MEAVEHDEEEGLDSDEVSLLSEDLDSVVDTGRSDVQVNQPHEGHHDALDAVVCEDDQAQVAH